MQYLAGSAHIRKQEMFLGSCVTAFEKCKNTNSQISFNEVNIEFKFAKCTLGSYHLMSDGLKMLLSILCSLLMCCNQQLHAPTTM